MKFDSSTGLISRIGEVIHRIIRTGHHRFDFGSMSITWLRQFIMKTFHRVPPKPIKLIGHNPNRIMGIYWEDSFVKTIRKASQSMYTQ